MDTLIVASLLKQMQTQNKQTVYDLSTEHKVMLVFLRHFGCLFCRETLDDLSKSIQKFNDSGAIIVFIHMSNKEIAEKYFEMYGLKNAYHVSDKESYYYNMFKLGKLSSKQLINLQSFIKGYNTTLTKNNQLEIELEETVDKNQLPGIFIIENGQIINQFIHKEASDKPDYINLINH